VCAEAPRDPWKEELRRVLREFRDPIDGESFPLSVTDEQADEILNQGDVAADG
jgi:hypothetical protein